MSATKGFSSLRRLVSDSMTSPLYLLGPPLLLLVSIPLAFFAVVTTTVAISTLTIRVSIVYFELGIALVHAYLFPPPPKPAPKQPSPGRASPTRVRNRRGSVASTTSSQETAIPGGYLPRLQNKSGSFVTLLGTGEITRDFEGVGGWRIPGNDDEEALWMGMNSRLELPAVLPKRKHQRSLTSGSQKYTRSPEAMRMSPMQSRARTPVPIPATESERIESYFPPQSTMRPLSSSSDPSKCLQEQRRNSASGSCSSESASHSRRTSVALKQAGD